MKGATSSLMVNVGSKRTCHLSFKHRDGTGEPEVVLKQLVKKEFETMMGGGVDERLWGQT